MKNEKAPSVTGGAPENSLYAIVSAREILGSPAQGGLNAKRPRHGGRADEDAHDETPEWIEQPAAKSFRPTGERWAYTTAWSSCLYDISHFRVPAFLNWLSFGGGYARWITPPV